MIRTPIWLKKLTVPFTNATRETDAVQLWEVRWTSRYGEYHYCTKPEMEAFTSPEAADEFAESLRNAFKLIRHTDGTKVTVRKVGDQGPILSLVRKLG